MRERISSENLPGGSQAPLLAPADALEALLLVVLDAAALEQSSGGEIASGQTTMGAALDRLARLRVAQVHGLDLHAAGQG